MNPSTAALVAAIEGVVEGDVVLLPNNKNVIMAAEQAADHSSKRVRVVPTSSLQAGLVALVAFDPALGAEENAAALAEALSELATGAVTVASRDVSLNGVDGSQGRVARTGGRRADRRAARRSTRSCTPCSQRLLAEPRGLLTLLTGDDAPALDVLLEELAASHPDLELEVHEGGQPHYPLLLAAE